MYAFDVLDVMVLLFLINIMLLLFLKNESQLYRAREKQLASISLIPVLRTRVNVVVPCFGFLIFLFSCVLKSREEDRESFIGQCMGIDSRIPDTIHARKVCIRTRRTDIMVCPSDVDTCSAIRCC